MNPLTADRQPCLRAIVFDLDDTLYPEHQYVQSGIRAVAAWAERQFGMPREHVLEELENKIRTGVRNRTFDGWLAAHRLDPVRWVPEMVRVYREHNPQIALFPELAAMLPRWRRQYRLGLVTDGYLEVQRRKIAACRLADFLDAIVCSDELGRDAWKPSARPFALVLQRLGVAGDEAVYVGDNPAKDFRGAKLLGMGTIRVRRPGGLHSNVEPLSDEDSPHTEVSQWSDVDAALAIFGRSTAAPPYCLIERP
ncbi:MAG: HAD-IA family hydrolase [Pirellulales bacterium]|nr:HAD-IA family hydrolase [Pirellulales bacterium]